MNYVHRELETTFLEANDSFKAILVTGARQVGKSTMLKHLAENQKRTYVNLDILSDRTLAQSDPYLFFQAYKPPILIDEVQKAPELFEAMKSICDASEEKGLFWLTGSQGEKLLAKSRESLSGRLAILNLYGFSQKEKMGLAQFGPLSFDFPSLLQRQKEFPPNNVLKVFDHIWQGGMPEVQQFNDAMLATYFNSYIETYLMRDAVEDNGIRNTTGFRKLLRACAAFAGSLLNYSDIASASDVTLSTAKEWIRILQNMGIVYLLEPYANNALKRLVKTPKLYFCDTGLCAYLAMWPTKETLMNGAASGHYYENYVLMELIKSQASHPQRTNLSFYRDTDAKEIDVIFEDSEAIHPLEIKKSATPNRSEAKKFTFLDKNAVKRGAGGIICMCEKPLPIDALTSFIPSNLI